MRNILENYTPDANFWEVNPQFTTVEPFRQLWKGDKSRGKGSTSKLMWAISLAFHPKSDMYYLSDGKFRVAKDILKVKEKDIDSFWEDNKHLTDAFIDAALTQAEKSLIAWENRLKNRDDFLAKQTYTFGFIDDNGIEFKDNTKSLDDMASKTGKFYDEFFKIKKELHEEDVVRKSGRIKSETSRGEI